jgi:hypothetical protein
MNVNSDSDTFIDTLEVKAVENSSASSNSVVEEVSKNNISPAPKLDLSTSTIMFAEATARENPEYRPLYKSFSSTNQKIRYQSKFDAIFQKVKPHAEVLEPAAFCDYFVEQRFTISQGQKHMVLVGQSPHWRTILLVWMCANDTSFVSKFDLKIADKKEHNDPYRGLPFSRKQVKHVLRNFNRIPPNQLEELRRQVGKIPEAMLPDDTFREFYKKVMKTKE